MEQRPRRAEAGGSLRSSKNNRNHQRYHGGGGRGMENCATQRGARKRVRQEKSNARLNRRFPLPSTPPPPRFQWSLRKRAHPRHKCGSASSTGRLPPSPRSNDRGVASDWNLRRCEFCCGFPWNCFIIPDLYLPPADSGASLPPSRPLRRGFLPRGPDAATLPGTHSWMTFLNAYFLRPRLTLAWISLTRIAVATASRKRRGSPFLRGFSESPRVTGVGWTRAFFVRVWRSYRLHAGFCHTLWRLELRNSRDAGNY